jgi:hypothetical protein
MMTGIKILVGKHAVKVPRGRNKRRWDHNIKMDLGEIGWEVVDFIHVAQNRDTW